MKIVLAYSGGLDTSVCIPWLREKLGAEVIAYTSNVGQKEDPVGLRRKAMKTGACAFHYEDLRERFADEYIIPAVKAGAVYQDEYPLATALSRPLIAEGCVKVARAAKAGALAHGCTGKGNDQVRFELTFKYLAPDMKVVAPVREWSFKSREEEMDYARRMKIPVPTTKKKPYSIDWNLWGISIECGVLEDPWNEPPADIYQITRAPADAPARPEYATVRFERGVPVALDGKAMSPVRLISALTEAGGRNGVGRIDMVEDRLVGIKSREIYEAPAAVILHRAHTALEKMVMSRDLFDFKRSLAPLYARMVYYGQWFSQMKRALDAFVDETQRHVTGDVRVRLFRGSCDVVGRKSPASIYREALATYTAADLFDHTASRGFIDIFGLPSVLEGERERSRPKR